ncbi:hypothetical protein ACN28S_05225 [Cystobacter fuscus]
MPSAARPLSDGDFAAALPSALEAAETEDADGDGVLNLEEIQRGTFPADANSVPVDTGHCRRARIPSTMCVITTRASPTSACYSTSAARHPPTRNSRSSAR